MCCFSCLDLNLSQTRVEVTNFFSCALGLLLLWQMTAGRCHTLLSPVTEESGEEGTNSEISSPPACRSPSPVANTDASVNQVPPSWHSFSFYLRGMQGSIQQVVYLILRDNIYLELQGSEAYPLT